MTEYKMTPDLETGNPLIDREHRELIAAVNSLLRACSEGKGSAQMNETANFLSNYVNTHFAHEEQLQQQSGYPGYAAHKAFHDSYKKKLSEVAAELSKEGMAGLFKFNEQVGILITHIKTEDKKMAAFVGKK
ncbi:MAG: hemerythrin family protein [Ruminococcus sp.]|nr:hemerythrin family protein [Ruminococcus sp.]